MTVDVGVDGGQSEIRLAIAGRPDVVTSDGVAHADGDSVELLVAGVHDAWDRARLPGDELGTIVLGLTTMPGDAATAVRLAAAISGATGAREVVLCGDAVTAHAGALPGGHGVVMVVGTGIACLAIDAQTGATRRVDGDGYLLGDRGASFWIGRHGIAATLAAADGRGIATTLSGAAVDRFGPIETLAARVHALDRPVNAIAQFAQVVQDHARSGDAAAREIVAEAATAIVASIRAGAQVVSAGAVPVTLTGRTVSEGTPLREAVENGVAADPGLTMVEANGSPLDGACGLAAGGVPAAYEKLITIWRTT